MKTEGLVLAATHSEAGSEAGRLDDLGRVGRHLDPGRGLPDRGATLG